jgi:hypothetical protein
MGYLSVWQRIRVSFSADVGRGQKVNELRANAEQFLLTTHIILAVAASKVRSS